MSSAIPCRWCQRPIVIRMVRGGRLWPFNVAMFAAGDDAGSGFVPVSSAGRVVMVPAVEMSPARLAGVRWLASRHVCAEWAAQNRDVGEVEGLASALARVFAVG